MEMGWEMRTLFKLAVAVGLAIVFIPKPPQRQALRKRTLQDRRCVAAAKCTGTLYYDATTDLFFDMHGKVGTAIEA